MTLDWGILWSFHFKSTCRWLSLDKMSSGEFLRRHQPTTNLTFSLRDTRLKIEQQDRFRELCRSNRHKEEKLNYIKSFLNHQPKKMVHWVTLIFFLRSIYLRIFTTHEPPICGAQSNWPNCSNQQLTIVSALLKIFRSFMCNFEIFTRIIQSSTQGINI